MSYQETVRLIVSNIEKVIIGKTPELYQILKGIFAGGHILIEDVPGVGKTTLVKALAKSLELSYSRIQFTPDLLPSDILGVSVYNRNSGTFEFKKGPVFANILLADEINRTSPKTQSALLEVMEESQVSEGNNTYYLEKPFIVLATQNPVEYQGTFNLPEAQLDRFMIKTRIGYADEKSESEILQTYSRCEPLKEITKVAGAMDVIAIQGLVRNIKVSRSITEYIVRLANATRDSKYIALGASTRASMSLLRIAQASAFIDNRDFVIPEDVKSNAAAVLSHRLTISSLARANGLDGTKIISEILDKTYAPRIYNND
ncbi:MAG: AAA family ATPase [Pseudomonadota bacterium]